MEFYSFLLVDETISMLMQRRRVPIIKDDYNELSVQEKKTCFTK